MRFFRYMLMGSSIIMPSVAYGALAFCPSALHLGKIELRKQLNNNCEIINIQKEGLTFVWSSNKVYPCRSLIYSVERYMSVVRNVSDAIKKPLCIGTMENGHPTCSYTLSNALGDTLELKLQLLMQGCELEKNIHCAFNCPQKSMIPGNIIKPLLKVTPFSPSKKNSLSPPTKNPISPPNNKPLPPSNNKPLSPTNNKPLSPFKT